MKIKVKIEQEIEVKKLIVSAEVRYWEGATVNGKDDTDEMFTPFRKGNNWNPTIDIETGVIADWPVGTVANIHFMVCNTGVYQLADSDGKVVKEIDGYVPKFMCPEGEGYGDYIIMKIDGNGKIANWVIDLSEFEAAHTD